jgi:hypothetical protein
MHPFTATIITAALFHYPAYGLPITSNGNDRISKRHATIRRFLAAVGRWSAEVPS